MSRYLRVATGVIVLLGAGGFAGWMLGVVDGEDETERSGAPGLVDAARAVVVPTAETSRKLVVPPCPPTDAEVDDAVPSAGRQRPNTLVLPPASQTRTVLVPACNLDAEPAADETPGGRFDAQRHTQAGILLLAPGATIAGTGDDDADATEASLRPESVLVVPGDSDAVVVRVPRCREDEAVEEHVTLSDPDRDGVIQAPECGSA